MAARKKSPKKPVERNLTRELAALLDKTLLPSLEERARTPAVAEALTAQFHLEQKANRTAEKRDAWVSRTLEQVGVAWVLSVVFVRTLEDRGYLTHARIAGDGAADSEHLFFDQFPSLTQRDYLLAVFRELSHVPGGDEVLGPKHNPAWRLSPSTEAVRELLGFFRETDAGGRLVWSFAGDDTRFLGDLYQNISENVRERYALLQTPEFVEEFILDLTLEPAIREYGLEEVRLLDPTCGSGHFLLGAFNRLFEARQREAPGKPVKEHAFAALGQVYGADVNPYAAAIARFRLVLAYLRAAEIDKLKHAPRLPSNVVVTDSLLFHAKDQTLHFAGIVDDATLWGGEMFQLEDPREATRVFSRKFHAVVGNPPYITCKDAKLREEYRDAYKESASGKFALSAPFTERFFQLAVDGGFVGMINANSFMKREFGKKLIQVVLKRLELTHVMDTAGAYIPGHGTPTVLLFGRNRTPIADKVSAVLGKRGEPTTPDPAEQGLVWSSIREHFAEIGFENEYISTAEVARETFNKHPWSLGGGGAAELKELLEKRAEKRLGDVATDIGFDAIMGEDELFVGSEDWLNRLEVAAAHRRSLVEGEVVRDWAFNSSSAVLFPYSPDLEPEVPPIPKVHRHFWRYRQALLERRQFGKNTIEAGLKWFEYRSFYKSKRCTVLSIAFAEVATHNHFVLDRGGKVFKQTAPIIKLPESASEDEHLALTAYLNSSTACFWMKQVFYPKARSDGDVGEDKGKAEANRFAFAATGMHSLPIPPGIQNFASLAEAAAARATVRARAQPAQVLSGRHSFSDVAAALHTGAAQADRALRELVVLQEDIDWLVYKLAGLGVPDVAARSMSSAAVLLPDERPFASDMEPELNSSDLEIWRARKVAIDAIPALALLETSVNKRLWAGARGFFALKAATYDEKSIVATREVLASQVEGMVRERPLSARSLQSRCESGELAHLIDYIRGADESFDLGDVATAHAVPYLPALRFTETGLQKRAQWEQTWALQRREDAGETVEIPVPPKYDSKDFRDPIYWRLRGKLDVPKERFISYPGAEKDDDKSPLYGWAGWDHLQQATALAGLYHERKTEDGWAADRLVPLLAGLLELLPWLKQWHNEPNEELGGEGAGDWYERYVEAEARSLGKTLDDLRSWRPEKGSPRRKK